MNSDRNLPRLAVVIPCYNEEKALPVTIPVIETLLQDMYSRKLISSDSYILCCDDGSRDQTWNVISEMHKRTPQVKGVALAHNRGHQYALLSGLMTAMDNCDMAVSIDADLQDDPSAIIEMVEKFHEGFEIVYGVRASRQTDTWFKRNTARAFYSFQQKMGLETVYDHADFRLMSNRALHLLSHYGESNLFLRGIIPQIGLKTTVVYYNRGIRVAGESKYPLGKMLSFSIDGITSFSARPIRMIFFVGLFLLLLDIAMGIYVLLSYFSGAVIPGWSSIMLSVWFLGSLTLVAIGIVGEYIGKIFVETKHRPRYEIKDSLF